MPVASQLWLTEFAFSFICHGQIDASFTVTHPLKARSPLTLRPPSEFGVRNMTHIVQFATRI
jgi:hypothetical protein